MQQPPGYNQGQQQGGQPQQPQGPAPQYGAQQMPYMQPQKKGMPGWAWGLIIGGIVLFCGFPLLAILAIPLITTNTRDARRAEGEQLMGAGRDTARVHYAKTMEHARSFSSIPDSGYPMEFSGKYYRVDDPIRQKPGDSAEITCSPQQTMSDGTGRLEFQWGSGQGQIRWDP